MYTDRWPGYNQHLADTDKRAKLYNYAYSFFPQPDRYVFLSGDAQTIFDRKKELSVSKIEKIQTEMRKKLMNK